MYIRINNIVYAILRGLCITILKNIPGPSLSNKIHEIYNCSKKYSRFI